MKCIKLLIYFNPIIVLFLTILVIPRRLNNVYFNPIIVLFLTRFPPIRNKKDLDFNPIIVLFLTTNDLNQGSGAS